MASAVAAAVAVAASATGPVTRGIIGKGVSKLKIKALIAEGRWPLYDRAVAEGVRADLEDMQVSIHSQVVPGEAVAEDVSRTMRRGIATHPVVLAAIDRVWRTPLAGKAGSDGKVLRGPQDAMEMFKRLQFEWLEQEYECSPLLPLAQWPYDTARGKNRSAQLAVEDRIKRSRYAFGLPTTTDRVVLAMVALVVHPAVSRSLQGGDVSHKHSLAAMAALTRHLVRIAARGKGPASIVDVDVDWVDACAGGNTRENKIPLILRPPKDGGRLVLPKNFERLRRMWAKHNFFEGGLVRYDPEGVPREVSVMSRVLADTWLGGLEQYVQEQLETHLGIPANEVKVIRWSSSALVVVQRPGAQRPAKVAVKRFLASRGLHLAEREERPRDRGAFGMLRTCWLGYEFLQLQSANPRGEGPVATALKMRLHRRQVERDKPTVVAMPNRVFATLTRKRMKHITKVKEQSTADEVALHLNMHLQSWRSHYGFAVCGSELRRMRYFVLKSFVGKFLFRKFKKSSAAERFRITKAIQARVELTRLGDWEKVATGTPTWHDSLFRNTFQRAEMEHIKPAVATPYYRNLQKMREERRKRKHVKRHGEGVATI
ncbi:hypothetical protein M885DRAFT_625744 [Pelagophyceae sp. CCMP2097]|nr:hypothetical protein M885DRAFT_625744 [Pelagophyceae sp. CCMP2097]|mmetsp:Transcript_13901/g.46388  ORF Transcript_13901/g.46388 Transcript_13901/m.46388 type:complete len:599 (-) Transcript_13901:2316-4112(-)